MQRNRRLSSFVFLFFSFLFSFLKFFCACASALYYQSSPYKYVLILDYIPLFSLCLSTRMMFNN